MDAFESATDKILNGTYDSSAMDAVKKGKDQLIDKVYESGVIDAMKTGKDKTINAVKKGKDKIIDKAYESGAVDAVKTGANHLNDMAQKLKDIGSEHLFTDETSEDDFIPDFFTKNGEEKMRFAAEVGDKTSDSTIAGMTSNSLDAAYSIIQSYGPSKEAF